MRIIGGFSYEKDAMNNAVALKELPARKFRFGPCDPLKELTSRVVHPLNVREQDLMEALLSYVPQALARIPPSHPTMRPRPVRGSELVLKRVEPTEAHYTPPEASCTQADEVRLPLSPINLHVGRCRVYARS